MKPIFLPLVFMGVELQINNDRCYRLPSYARPAFVRLVRELDVNF
jgi:hypothetical protein